MTENPNCLVCLDGSRSTDGHYIVTVPDGNTTTVASPAFPLFYPANLDTTWQMILVSPGSFIRLVFVNFSLPESGDVLYILRGRSVRESLWNITGSDGIGLELVSGGDELWMRFVSGDVSVQMGMGFLAELSAVGMYGN